MTSGQLRVIPVPARLVLAEQGCEIPGVVLVLLVAVQLLHPPPLLDSCPAAPPPDWLVRSWDLRVDLEGGGGLV